MKILIPLQLCSTRVKLKNIRPFYEKKSLFDIKMEQLLKHVRGESIYISSESDDVIPLVKKYGAYFLKRPAGLTGNAIKQPDLIGAILSQLPHDDEDIMWVQVTQPLFDAFGTMLDRWETVKKTHDSMVAVKTVRHHIVSQAGIPINFNFGHWHKVSQELPPLYEILWSAFILKRHTIETVKYHIGMDPYLIPFDDVTLVDIDTEEDFRLASEIYQLKTKRN